MLSEVLGELLGKASPETVIGHLGQVEHSLSWHWRLPDDTPEEIRLKLGIDERRELILDQWPKISLPLFGGRTPEQAAGEPRVSQPAVGRHFVVQLSDADSTAETYNELRRKLNLPEMTDLDAAGVDVINQLPLDRICRLKAEQLSDDQLKQAFNRAAWWPICASPRRLAPEVIKRPDMPVAEYKLAAYRWMALRSAANSAESLRQ